MKKDFLGMDALALKFVDKQFESFDNEFEYLDKILR